MSSKKIELMSSDGEYFTVDEAVAREFKIIGNMIDDDCADQTIPIPNIKAKILALVIEYAKKRIEIASTEEPEDEKKKKLKIWEDEFMNIGADTICGIMLAANFLNIKSLLELTFQTMADLVKDKGLEEVRLILGIKNDYTWEEEAAVREEHAWAFE